MRFVAVRDGAQIAVNVERTGSGYVVTIGDRELEADLVSANTFARSLLFADGSQFLLGHSLSGDTHEVSFGNRIVHVDLFDPLAMKRGRTETAESGSIKAIMPGRIVRVLVEKGQTVARGAGLLVLEAMKMENELKAPTEGVISEVLVEVGQTVETGELLITIS
jgi:acetyl/propionyl-CoA carboxylase alpha subunit